MIDFTDVGPDVAGLTHDTITGPHGEPYMVRYYVTHAPRYSVRFHHLLTSDPGRDLHDHPWDFTSLLLTGAYRETTPHGTTDYQAPCLLTHHAEDLHRLDLLDGPMWTYVCTGPVRRRWGFTTTDGWVHWSDYPDAGGHTDNSGSIVGILAARIGPSR